MHKQIAQKTISKMKYFKQFSGIIATAMYSIIIRILAYFGILDINSMTYLIITPMVLGFIPFFLKDEKFINSISKIIFFPLISVLLFLIICVITRLEDLLCFIIIGLPYILISVIVSFFIRTLIRTWKKDVTKNALPVLLIPFVFGAIEKNFEKQKTEKYISQEIIIDRNCKVIWNNLFEVPDLSNAIDRNIYNYIGVPSPSHSVYNGKTNTRLGYFDHNVVLNESVTKRKEYRELTFSINLQQSDFSQNQTLSHILNENNLEFENISYKLVPISHEKTKLILSTKFSIYSNIPLYADFWSERIINDFESKLLHALKKVIEKQNI